MVLRCKEGGALAGNVALFPSVKKMAERLPAGKFSARWTDALPKEEERKSPTTHIIPRATRRPPPPPLLLLTLRAAAVRPPSESWGKEIEKIRFCVFRVPLHRHPRK